MARRTFFSFHYEKDVWRATNVRKSSALKANIAAEWIDASLWEETKKNDQAIQRLIDKALQGTTATAVLIGAETSSRRWVKYEIDQSLKRGNGVFGIYIHNIEDANGRRDVKGENPLPPTCKTYDWVLDNGYSNLGTWVELAARGY